MIKRDKYFWFLIIVIIAFLIFINFRVHMVQGWDESRHAVQGHLFYDYYKTLLSGEWMTFKSFVASYQEKGYNAGWFMIDPPLHAMIQGFTFLLFGASTVTSGFATQLFIILGAVLLYLLSLKILKKEYLAITVVALYLFSPIIPDLGGLSMLAMPISFMMIGWFYFTFHCQGKRIRLKFSDAFRITLKTNVLIGGLFLAAATLMKYHSIIYVAVFYAVYIIYLWIKKRSFPTNIFVAGLVQGIIASPLVLWWMKYSLLDHGLLQRVLYEGTGRGGRNWQSISWIFAYFTKVFTETKFIALFALVPIITWFKQKKESFLAKTDHLFLLILIMLITATLILSARHFRYFIHAVPFVFIVIVKGVEEFAEFVVAKVKAFSKINAKFPNINIAFLTIAIILVVISGSFSFSLMQKQVNNLGKYNPELQEYLSSIPNPKLLINIDGDLEDGTAHWSDGTAYYYNQDLFVYEAMITNDKLNIHDPREMQQYVQIFRFNMIQNYEAFAQQVSQQSSNIKTLIIIFNRPDKQYFNLPRMDQALLDNGFKKTELRWYNVYEKG